ncbi:2-polyprenyl-6-methoxyphenol hydroxylase-like FAD-dependent oxidoreductase [Thermocatellispora tengchongensis]|uniref:2-polyprenyl-6-methoxyphenol hydroxylase-like FAD-dependent oxidoreductase n=1 Tax=Thermocatellispora tengchongensis TaxID=1073253 RepID=A0A840PGP9_9ACTN|nr:2-polyprenyl-6-methoxyphenol hydroxylase-like FAD-dependent oxidoreductase [Thermocatellispora tengchongensis]
MRGAALGRGASQALIGAYILAGEPAVAGGDHTAAFAAYEAAMRGFAAEHQQMGREGADRFFMGMPPQEALDTARARIVRLRDYAPGFAAAADAHRYRPPLLRLAAGPARRRPPG